MTDEHEQWLIQQRKAWVAALKQVLGPNPATRSEWTDLDDMVAVLEPLLIKEQHHVYLPTGGGQSMIAVEEGNERNTLALYPNERVRYLLKPRTLTIHYFPDAPEQSFVFIETKKLKPSGIYDHEITDGQEEVLELSPGDYQDRSAWDAGYCGRDEEGDEIPLPDTATLVCRFLEGSFAIVGEGSFWNSASGTYDGEHSQLGQDRMREAIEGGIKRRAAGR